MTTDQQTAREMTDAALIAAHDAIEDHERLTHREQAVLDEIERRAIYR